MSYNIKKATNNKTMTNKLKHSYSLIIEKKNGKVIIKKVFAECYQEAYIIGYLKNKKTFKKISVKEL